MTAIPSEDRGGDSDGLHETASTQGHQVANRCVFCERIANGEYDAEFADYVTFEPLNPVTPGHMLVVPKVHTANLNSSELEADQVGWALRGFTNDLEPDVSYNIITSKGEAATQTIQHLHFHIVPRRKDDGLALPWTGQEQVIDLANTSPEATDE